MKNTRCVPSKSVAITRFEHICNGIRKFVDDVFCKNRNCRLIVRRFYWRDHYEQPCASLQTEIVSYLFERSPEVYQFVSINYYYLTLATTSSYELHHFICPVSGKR